jgi:hypothetical protein
MLQHIIHHSWQVMDNILSLIFFILRMMFLIHMLKALQQNDKFSMKKLLSILKNLRKIVRSMIMNNKKNRCCLKLEIKYGLFDSTFNPNNL